MILFVLINSRIYENIFNKTRYMHELKNDSCLNGEMDKKCFDWTMPG